MISKIRFNDRLQWIFTSGSAAVFLLIITLGLSPVAAYSTDALITATWSTTSGNWTTATEWACTPGSVTCVPSNNVSNTYDTVLNSSGNTLTLDTSSTPDSITINTLSLQAGTLDVGSGATLKLPNGITDIPVGTGLSIEGTFTSGSYSPLLTPLSNLTSVEGTLTLDNGQETLMNPGTLTISSTGVVNVSGAGTILLGGNRVTNSGDVTISAAGTLAPFPYSQTSGTTTVSGKGSNLSVGFLSNDARSKLFIQDGGTVGANEFDNSGSIITGNAMGDSGNNSIISTDAFGNGPGATLSLMAKGDNATISSDFQNGGTASLAAGTKLFVHDDYVQGLPAPGYPPTTLVNGTLTVGHLYWQVSGTTQINSGGLVSVTSMYKQTSGVTDVDGTLIVPAVQITGGTLKGAGLIEGTSSGGAATVTLTNATFQPSDPMHIDGVFTLDPTDTWAENIDSPSNFGALDVQGTPGTATLAGTLDINLPDGFGFLTDGESFVILDAVNGVTGTFSKVNGLTFGSGDFWTVSYGADTVMLTANITSSTVPEPASLLLLGTGLLGLTWPVRQRKEA